MRQTLRIIGRVAFVGVFIALVISNFSLRRRLEAAERDTDKRTPAMFKAGDAVPRFPARDRADRVVALGGPAGEERVLVLVHPRCKYCSEVLSDIAARPAMPNVAVVSIAPKALSAEVTQKLPATTAAYFIDRIAASPIRAHAQGVPQILRVGKDGKVAHVCASVERCESELLPPRACDICAAPVSGM